MKTNFRVSRLLAISTVLTCVASALPAAAAADAPLTKSCVTQNATAKMLTNYPAEWPALALMEHASGTAVVRVYLGEDGTPKNATIVKSTGNAPLDAAALATTRSQRFSAEIQDCQHVAGSYLVEVDYPRSE